MKISPYKYPEASTLEPRPAVAEVEQPPNNVCKIIIEMR